MQTSNLKYSCKFKSSDDMNMIWAYSGDMINLSWCYNSCAQNSDFPSGIKDNHWIFCGSKHGLNTTPQKIEIQRQAALQEDMKDKKGRWVCVIRRRYELKMLKASQKACLTDDEILTNWVEYFLLYGSRIVPGKPERFGDLAHVQIKSNQ